MILAILSGQTGASVRNPVVVEEGQEKEFVQKKFLAVRGKANTMKIATHNLVLVSFFAHLNGICQE